MHAARLGLGQVTISFASGATNLERATITIGDNLAQLSETGPDAAGAVLAHELGHRTH